MTASTPIFNGPMDYDYVEYWTGELYRRLYQLINKWSAEDSKLIDGLKEEEIDRQHKDLGKISALCGCQLDLQELISWFEENVQNQPDWSKQPENW